MSESTVVMTQPWVRGAVPFELSVETYDTLIFSMLDEGPGLITERMTPFFCPDCRFKIINGYEFKALCEFLKTELPDDYKLAGRLLGKNVQACAALIQKTILTGKSAPNGKGIKKICDDIIEWLPEEPVAIRVEERDSDCEHPNAFKSDRELHRAA